MSRKGLWFIYPILAAVVAAPVSLSSHSLYDWAHAHTGLGLSPLWSVPVFAATDGGALVCIALTVVAAHRGESAGMAHLLMWLLAGISAYANWRAGVESGAHDAVWFLPLMSGLAVVMVDVVTRAVRHWVRTDIGLSEPALPRFRLLRWLFAPAETFGAVRVAVLDGVTDQRAAVAAVRARRSRPVEDTPPPVSLLSKADAVRAAMTATGARDVPTLHAWLAAQGVEVSKSYVSTIARKEMMRRPQLAAVD